MHLTPPLIRSEEDKPETEDFYIVELVCKSSSMCERLQRSLTLSCPTVVGEDGVLRESAWRVAAEDDDFRQWLQTCAYLTSDSHRRTSEPKDFRVS
jgi:hypothetical protein